MSFVSCNGPNGPAFFEEIGPGLNPSQQAWVIHLSQWFIMVQYSWQHTLINPEHLKGSAFNAEVLLGVLKHGLMISFITLTCIDGQQLNKQYDHNDFQVDVPDSIGVSKINLSMYVWFVTLVTFYLVELKQYLGYTISKNYSTV